MNRAPWVFLLLCAVMLSGCSRPEVSDAEPTGPEFAQRPADAPRAAPEDPGAFDFLRYRVALDGSAPEICLQFSHALDPRSDYSAYVARSSGAALAFDVQGSTLCLGGFTFSDTPELLLRRGLPSADGEALAADAELSIEFAARPAYVGFAGSGVILPRVDADGVAIETVNVEAVRIRVLRINDRALAFKRITSGFSAGDGEYGGLRNAEDPSDVGEMIWSGSMDTHGAANEPVTTVFPIAASIGQLRPGAYFMEVSDAAGDMDDYPQPARAKRWLLITDLALTAYRGADGMDIMVRSLHSAAPEDEVRVQLIARNNEILASAVSDAAGRLRFDAPLLRGEDVLAPRYLFAYGADNDFALLDLDRNPVDLTELGVGGRERPQRADGFMWLDRGVYRPGETVHASVLLRDTEGRALTDRGGDLVLIGPNGIEAARERFESATHAGGLFHDYALPAAAARGQWELQARLDGIGVVASTRFAVEDFVPQRVELTLETSDALLRPDEVRSIEARARFLYGAPGVGLPLEGSVRVEKDPRPFPERPGYRFGLHEDPFTEIAIDLQGSVADGEGMADLLIDPGNAGQQASVPLRLHTVVRVIEPGGRAVADDLRIPWRPRDLYLGLKPGFEGSVERNTASVFEVLAVDATGTPQAAELNWMLWRNDWDYDWYRDPGGRWQWRRTARRVPIEQGRVDVTEDGGRIELPDLDWGEYELRLSTAQAQDSTRPGPDGAVASTAFDVGWGRQIDGVEAAPDRVRVAGPEAPVQIGSEVRLAIRAPYAGRAEVVIASDRVLATRSIEVAEGETELTLPVTADWGAGAYAMVSVFTPRDAVSRPTPRRAVGVAWLPVDVSARTLTLDLNTPERIRPRQTVALDIEVDGAEQEASVWLTLAAVDEGILALTRFASPAPHDHFFGKIALGVALLDDYGRLLDPNQGAAAAVRSGADQIGGAGLTVVPTDTVALFSGPVAVRDGKASVALQLPDFNGELRLMAVAWSEDALGQASTPLTVRDAAIAELILPRFLAPGDAARGTLSVDNVEAGAGDFSVSLEGSAAAALSAQFDFSLEASERREELVAVRGGDVGVGSLSLAATGPNGFDVARTYPIETRSAWLPASASERHRLDPGASFTVRPDLLDDYLPGSVTAELSASPSPIDVAPLLASLHAYPYECSEQLTSRALPLLYGAQLQDPASGAAGAAGSDTRPIQAAEARTTAQDAIETLLSRQAWDGSIGLWRVGDRGATPWLGAYFVDYLTRARSAGLPVPEAAVERALQALEPIARGTRYRIEGYDTSEPDWHDDTNSREKALERAAAYALYVRAREGYPDRSRLRYMHDERMAEIANPLARAHIGAGLALIGDRARATSAFDAAESALGFEQRWDWYQSPLRDLAGVLALSAEAEQTDRAERLLGRLEQDLPDAERMTTQEKAFTLLALRSLSRAGARAGAGVGATLQLDATGALTARTGRRFAIAPDAPGGTLTNRGNTTVWVTQRLRGQTREAPAAVQQGVRIDKRLHGLDGQEIGTVEGSLSVARGDRLIVRLELAAEGDRTMPAVITDLLPAGFEIEAILQPEETRAGALYHWLGPLAETEAEQARDDRFVAAVDLYGGSTYQVAYLVRAVTPGTFALPGAVVEDMYRSDQFARTPVAMLHIDASD